MLRIPALKIVAALIVPLLVLAGSGRGALAGTSSQTSVTVEIVNQGVLDVAWGNGPTTFLVDGEAPALNASTPSVIATASLDLVIADTRLDGNRTGYAISLAASGFTADGLTPITPSQLMVIGVEGAPAGISAATAIGQPLDTPVRLLAVANDAPAVDATLTVTVAMTIYAGTPPGVYSGEFSFEVLPLTVP